MAKTVEVVEFVKRGEMLVNTDCLDYDDPMHVYNQLARKGLTSEDYGCIHPLDYRFASKTRGELYQIIINLEKELESNIQYNPNFY